MADLIPFTTVDYLSEARERVTEQFKDKSVFDKYLELLLYSQIEIQNTLKDLMQLRNIDTAVGAQLDVIGRIVGQERELIAADLYEFFGFVGALTAQPMGELGSSEGGIFYTFGTPLGGNRTLDDETYRKFIKAKIFKNVTASTPEEFISVVNLIFDTDTTYITEGAEAEFTVYFGRPLSNLDKALLDYISYNQAYPTRMLPKTIGVKMNFNFDGIPSGAGGYGTGYGVSYGG
jgi:hypothetical protein